MNFVVDQLLANAQAHAAAGRSREAAEACEQVLKAQPDNPRALFLLGFLLHRAGQMQSALQRLTEAVTANPAAVEPYFLIGLIHQQQRNLGGAIDAYQRAVRLQLGHPKALNNLGRALLDSGRIDEGLSVLQKAVSADSRNASAYTNLGDALRMTGDFQGSVAAQRQAIRIDPGFAEAHGNLGTALAKQGNIPEAMRSIQRAIEINPKLATPHYNLARLYQDQGKLDDAIRHCQIAIELRPQYADALNLQGNLAGITGDTVKAIVSQRAAVQINPENAWTHSNLLLSFHYVDELTDEQLFQAHLAWASRHGHPLMDSARSPTGSIAGPVGNRPLRIGYVSPNLMNHSVAYFAEPVIAAHDRSVVKVMCYADNSKVDEVTVRLRGHADLWRDTTGKTNAVVAEMIRADGIDILVDLAGHTAENRMKLFMLKPAPVQVTWLGYPDTTGISEMDYRITDAIADPPGVSDRFHTEKMIRIEGGCWAYQPPADAPPVAPPPLAANGFVTFGSFNNLPKVTPAVLKTWARILHAVPNSRLFLKALGLRSQAGRDNVLKVLSSAGVHPDRINLIGWTPSTASHLELYNQLDIALDPFPYNGTTTTCEALWMGVPVISFPGRTHAGRVGASLLTHAGLSELLATDAEDYVARAVEYAENPDRLARLRADLRTRFASSPVCDGPRLCRALENAFSKMITTV